MRRRWASLTDGCDSPLQPLPYWRHAEWRRPCSEASMTLEPRVMPGTPAASRVAVEMARSCAGWWLPASMPAARRPPPRQTSAETMNADRRRRRSVAETSWMTDTAPGCLLYFLPRTAWTDDPSLQLCHTLHPIWDAAPLVIASSYPWRDYSSQVDNILQDACVNDWEKQGWKNLGFLKKVFMFLGFLGFIGFIGFFVQRSNTTVRPKKHMRKKNISYISNQQSRETVIGTSALIVSSVTTLNSTF